VGTLSPVYAQTGTVRFSRLMKNPCVSREKAEGKRENSRIHPQGVPVLKAGATFARRSKVFAGSGQIAVASL
jgi:hypothetical protein